MICDAFPAGQIPNGRFYFTGLWCPHAALWQGWRQDPRFTAGGLQDWAFSFCTAAVLTFRSMIP